MQQPENRSCIISAVTELRCNLEKGNIYFQNSAAAQRCQGPEVAASFKFLFQLLLWSDAAAPAEMQHIN
jgi:hypothetical protein